MANWYVSVNGSQAGPYPDAEFERMRAQGMVPPDAYVWCDGMVNWILASELPGGASPARSSAFSDPLIGPGPGAYPSAMGGAGFGAAPGGEVPAAAPNGLVITAYVLGGCALLCSCLTGIPAIVCAVVAMGQPGQRKNGIIALIVSIVCTALGMLIGIILNFALSSQAGY